MAIDERLAGLSQIERWLWGRAVKQAQMREPPSRYWKERDRYGPLGAAHFLVARQLLFLASLGVVGIFVVVAIAGTNGDPTLGVNTLLVGSLLLCANTARHGVKASRLGRQYRQDQDQQPDHS